MEKQSSVSPATLPERAAAQEYRAAVERRVLSGQFSLLIGWLWPAVAPCDSTLGLLESERQTASSATKGADYGNYCFGIHYSRTLEQGKARRLENPIQAEGNMGNPGALADRKPMPGSCVVQLSDRQQASGL